MAGALGVVRKGSIELKCTATSNLRSLYVVVVLLSRPYPSSFHAALLPYARWSLVRKADSAKVEAFVMSYFVLIWVVFKTPLESIFLLLWRERRLHTRCLARVACCVHNVFKGRTGDLYTYTIKIASCNSLLRLLLAVCAALGCDTISSFCSWLRSSLLPRPRSFSCKIESHKSALLVAALSIIRLTSFKIPLWSLPMSFAIEL